ncbi:ethanolamine ammonia-lyase subunit EutC [Paenibacillus alginolyticus]|uniref:Ethanolamine ammonia-lyase small subunit n=1 Tax=Paenibacillus alginolyticus TaxID=59839 RepID=A0ABT4GN29_9BACL|nr:ethanolamine ammonia-lyase subunit EutC [Paenibacillus alginolyticus]MCY9697636.1 ethanolamine ammonia-lyase subunit EutC [Paenibacillus alginolyticus]MEC0148348.1 ethanolamine ammonia-lyase subunit EutC [Paenibacillus alginolyticus]
MNKAVPMDQLVDMVMAELEKKLSASKAADNPAAIRSMNSVLENEEAQRSTQVEKVSLVSELDTELDSAPVPELDTFTSKIPTPKWEEGMNELLASTPARIGVWRTGTRALTKEVLKFRRDHAAAVDSIYGEASQALLDEFGLFTVETRYENTENYLKRPDMGRIVTEEGIAAIQKKCKMKPQVQIVVSDGLSANAVDANLGDVYPSLLDSLSAYGLSTGTPFFVRGGRVAVMDHIGEIVQPEVLVLLIGERPGLVSSKSLSAYICYKPRKGTVESDRTVISNIHRGGTPPLEGGAHIGTIVNKMLEQKTSGVNLEI